VCPVGRPLIAAATLRPVGCPRRGSPRGSPAAIRVRSASERREGRRRECEMGGENGRQAGQDRRRSCRSLARARAQSTGSDRSSRTCLAPRFKLALVILVRRSANSISMRKPAIFNVSSGDAVIFFSSNSSLLLNYLGSLFGSLDNLHEL